MKEDRPGTLVCVCAADGRILLNALYDSEDRRIAESRKRRGISAPGRTSLGEKGGREDGKDAGQDVR